MKPQSQKQITFEEISAALDSHMLADAREILQSRTGAQITLGGIVLKIVKAKQRLHLKLDCVRPFEAFADFGAVEWQMIADKKVRKNSVVELTGQLQSFGTHAITLSDCTAV